MLVGMVGLGVEGNDLLAITIVASVLVAKRSNFVFVGFGLVVGNSATVVVVSAFIALPQSLFSY